MTLLNIQQIVTISIILINRNMPFLFFLKMFIFNKLTIKSNLHLNNVVSPIDCKHSFTSFLIVNLQYQSNFDVKCCFLTSSSVSDMRSSHNFWPLASARQPVSSLVCRLASAASPFPYSYFKYMFAPLVSVPKFIFLEVGK